MDVPDHLRDYWLSFLNRADARSGDLRNFYESFQIGNSRESADHGARLVLQGIKTATSSLLQEYEVAGGALPWAGALSVLEDGAGEPVCIVETTWLKILCFADVDEQFAFEYGEFDRTLPGWHNACRPYHAAQCGSLGSEMSDATKLVCERFRVLYAS